MQVKPGHIETYSGLYVDPLDLAPADVRLEDIAQALSNTCRYTGHCKRFYSVAEHSVRVANRVADLGGDFTAERFALLHDASEAYLLDLPRPVKQQMPTYLDAEEQAQRAICAALLGGELLSEKSRKLIKQADNDLLVTEARVLMPSHGAGWGVPGEVIRFDRPGWEPLEAEAAFVGRALDLGVPMRYSAACPAKEVPA